MKFGDIQINGDHLVWKNERSSKTRDGSKPNGHARLFHPPTYLSNDRPPSSNTDDSPFYLTVRHNFDHKSEPIWYHPKPMGVNKIGEFLAKASDILSSVNMSSSLGKIANHSARKTSITKLLSNDIHPLILSQLSGHKRGDSLNSYYVASKKQQKQMSNMLNDSCTSTSASSNKLPADVESSMMQDWDDFVMPLPSPTRSSLPASPRHHNLTNSCNIPNSVLYGAFPGASQCNFTINIYNGNHQDNCNQSPVQKRRRIIIIDED